MIITTWHFFSASGVLDSSDDLHSGEDVYEAIGGLLEDAVGAEREGEIRWVFCISVLILHLVFMFFFFFFFFLIEESHLINP